MVIYCCFLFCRDIKDYSIASTTTTMASTTNSTTSSTVSTSVTTVTTITNTTTNTTDTPATIVTETPKVTVEGQCSGVPATASLQVLYALAGKSAGFPIYEIVGAKVR